VFVVVVAAAAVAADVVVVVDIMGVLDFGDLAWWGDLAAEISALLEELDDVDEDEHVPDFLFLSIPKSGFTADESAPICEQVWASSANGLFLASI